MNNAHPQSLNSPSTGMMSAMVALAFFAVGLICLLACLAVLLLFPNVLSGNPYRLEVTALAALVLPGFAGSAVFGTFYAVSSVLTGSRLWSRPLAVAHWFLHTMGLCGMVLALGGMPFLENPFLGVGVGAVLQLIGVLLLFLNLVLTAAQHNRWEPESITVLFALFWLGVSAILGLTLLVHWNFDIFQPKALRYIEVYAIVSMAGFLCLGILGTTLKLFDMFLVGGLHTSGLMWTGCILINLGLFMIPITAVSFAWSAQSVPVGIIFLGSFLYLISAFLRIRTSNSDLTPGITLATCGLVVGVGLIGLESLLLAGAITPPELVENFFREQVRMHASLTVLGTVLMLSLGTGTHLVPLLVWRLRCLPVVREHNGPTADDLIDPRGLPVLLLCLVAGWIYIAVGQWNIQAAGVQLGVLCILIGILWFFMVIRPAVMLFLFGAMTLDSDSELPSTPPHESV